MKSFRKPETLTDLTLSTTTPAAASLAQIATIRALQRWGVDAIALPEGFTAPPLTSEQVAYLRTPDGVAEIFVWVQAFSRTMTSLWRVEHDVLVVELGKPQSGTPIESATDVDTELSAEYAAQIEAFTADIVHLTVKQMLLVLANRLPRT